MSATIVQSPSGAALHLHVVLAEGKPRAVVQINHGLAEHSARYLRFAKALSARGFAVYAHDHRGHGLSRATDAPLGRFAEKDGAATVTADVLAVHQRIASDLPELPVVVFGHSLGAAIALNFAQAHAGRIAGLALWNGNFASPAIDRLARVILLWERWRLGSDVPSRLLPRLTFEGWNRAVPESTTPFDWLSRDRGEVRLYLDDPLCGWLPSVSMWLDVFALMARARDPRRSAAIRRDLPLHFVGGEEDPSTDNGKAVELAARCFRSQGFSDVQLRTYAGTRHESLNEVNREAITADFLGWLDRVVER